MEFRCPHCKSTQRVKEPCTDHLRMAALKCPCCGGSIEMGSLPSSLRTCAPTADSTRCAILSAGNRLRLFDIARRTDPEPESLP